MPAALLPQKPEKMHPGAAHLPRAAPWWTQLAGKWSRKVGFILQNDKLRRLHSGLSLTQNAKRSALFLSQCGSATLKLCVKLTPSVRAGDARTSYQSLLPLHNWNSWFLVCCLIVRQLTPCSHVVVITYPAVPRKVVSNSAPSNEMTANKRSSSTAPDGCSH